jgi:hypothetical protein
MAICGRRIDLSINNLLLKGSVLCHNDWIIGLSVFVGENTKFQAPRPITRPNTLIDELNVKVIMLILFNFAVSFLLAIGRFVFIMMHRHSMRYMIPLEIDPRNKYKPLVIPFGEFDLDLESKRLEQFFIGWLYYFVTMADMVPVLLPALIFMLDWYFRKKILMDNTLNPTDKNAHVVCNPLNCENLSDTGIFVIDSSALLTGEMVMRHAFFDGHLEEIGNPIIEKVA